jgi:hypothetical protein
MRARYVVWPLLLLLVAACATLGDTSPQGLINEGNVTLTATANVIAQNVQEGVMTREEAQSALDRVRTYAKRLDAAQALLDTGDLRNAATQAKLLSSLIIALQREVAAKARKK